MNRLLAALLVTMTVPAAWGAGDGASSATRSTAATASPPVSGPASPAASPHGAMPPKPDFVPVKVAKAPGADGRTVAEVNATRAALNGKRVTIRAQVVKVTRNVMGTNWIHLRDGTGSADDQSNDVLVTSRDVPGVGDVVTARGAVRTDVELGSGYAYKVLVEDVSFER